MIICNISLRFSIVRLSLAAFALTMLPMLIHGEAKANVVCGVSSVALDFGESSTGTGVISYTCTNYRPEAQTFSLCIALGNPSWPGTANQPAFPLAWPDKLNFQVYRDPAMTQVWTANQPLTRQVSIPGGIGTSVTGVFHFYGMIGLGQSPPAGVLSAAFYNNIIGFAPGNSSNCKTSSGYYSGQQFTIPITAMIANDCTVTAEGDVDLGSVVPDSAPLIGSTAINVQCPSGTPYNIGLLPSNGNANGAGELIAASESGETIPYQLRSGSPTGPIWGNTASVSSVGNGLSGVGSGAGQSYPVYVSVPGNDYTPGPYRDTVRVTIHY